MDLYQGLVGLHIGLGVVALCTFWVAASARKGGRLHRQSGHLYFLAMWGIVLTALPMAVRFLMLGRVGIGVFFAFLVLITATSLWLARRAIRLKRAPAAYFDRHYLRLGILNALAGLSVFGLGLQRGNGLLLGFSWVGVVIGVIMVRKSWRQPSQPTWWLREHYGAMLGNGVATHVAFLSVGMSGVLRHLQLPWMQQWTWLQWLPWFLPLGVAMLAGVWLDRRYGAGLAPARSAASRHA